MTSIEAWKKAVARVSPTHEERTARSYTDDSQHEESTPRKGKYDFRHEGHQSKR